MAMPLYQRLADEVGEYRARIDKFSLFLHGEPLLDELLAERIRYAKARGIPNVFISTNAVLLDEARARELVAAGLDEIVISLDGVTPATYARTKPGLDFAISERHTEIFLKLRGAVRTTIRMVVHDANRDEGERFLARWAGQGIEVALLDAHSWGDKKTALRQSSGPRAKAPCHAPWMGMAVLWDGTVPLCCLDSEADYRLGDATRTSLAVIWRDEGYRRLREAHLARAYHCYALCAQCSYTYDVPQPDWWFAYLPETGV